MEKIAVKIAVLLASFESAFPAFGEFVAAIKICKLHRINELDGFNPVPGHYYFQ
jgi:hypothetical protein